MRDEGRVLRGITCALRNEKVEALTSKLSAIIYNPFPKNYEIRHITHYRNSSDD